MSLFHYFFFWIYLPTKILSWLLNTFIFEPVERIIQRNHERRESEKAFGKLNGKIEIYDPQESRKHADQA